MKAPAAITRKPRSAAASHSSSSASSYARLPYTATTTAGVPWAVIPRSRSTESAGTRPPNTGAAMTASSSAANSRAAGRTVTSSSSAPGHSADARREAMRRVPPVGEK